MNEVMDAVKRRKSEGSDKLSPIVWAAVTALSEFVESLNNINNRPQVAQDILREQILKQIEQQAQEIAKILNAESVESFTEQKSSMQASFRETTAKGSISFPHTHITSTHET